MKKVILLITCLGMINSLNAQHLQWAINEVEDSSAVSTALNYMVTTESIFDHDGNLLTVGRFIGEVDFDPTSGVDIRESKYSPILTTYNLTGFVKKNDPQGNLIWARTFQSNSYCVVNDIALDLSGNIYITGAFSGLLKSNLPNPLNSQNTITSDAFVMKLDTIGNVIWQKKFGGEDFSEKGSGIVCDTSDNVYVTGTYNNKYDFVTGAELATAGKNRAFVLFLDQTYGTALGFQGFGSTNLNENSEADGLGIGLDYSGGTFFPLIVLAGRFGGIADFRLNFTFTGVPDLRDAATGELFILKYNYSLGDSANFWVRNFEEYDINGESSMEIDTNNNIYFSNKERLFKYSQDGTFLWENATLNGRILDVEISQDGTIYTVGSFSWPTLNFNGTPNTPQYLCNHVGSEDGFIRKITASGAFVWARTLGSTGIDKVHTILANDSSFYISGRFADTTDFALGPDTAILLKPSNLSPGAFLAKYEIAENIQQNASVDACNFYQVNGQTYYNSTVQTVVFNNLGAVDSVVVLDITINDPSSANLTLTSCDSLVMNNQTFLSDGTYTQIIPNAAGCDSTITINLTITNADNTTSLQGSTISANAIGANYQWVDCDNGNNPVAGATNQSFTPAVNGNYAVIVTQNGCSAVSNCTTITIVGTNETKSSNGVTVYPNPSSGLFTIGGMMANTRLTVMNSLGEVLFSTIAGGTSESIDLSSLANGIYFLKLNHKENESILKISRN